LFAVVRTLDGPGGVARATPDTRGADEARAGWLPTATLWTVPPGDVPLCCCKGFDKEEAWPAWIPCDGIGTGGVVICDEAPEAP